MQIQDFPENVRDYWHWFLLKSPFIETQNSKVTYWSFSDSINSDNELLKLVLKWIKRGTSSMYDGYIIESKSLPKLGDFSIILDLNNEPKCIVRNISVTIYKFNEVSEKSAELEGEWDKTLNYWRKVHKEFFIECTETYNIEFKENTLIVCEEFELIYN